MENFKLFFQFILKFRHFFPSYFQDQAFSSKIFPRSGIFFQVTSKIRHFLPSTSKIRHFLPSYYQDSHISCKILQDQIFSSKIFQDTCKNNALSSKILEVKSDRFLQKIYGSSTGVVTYRHYMMLLAFKIDGVV